MPVKEQLQWCKDMGLSMRSMRKAAAILHQLKDHAPALQHSASAGQALPVLMHLPAAGQMLAELACTHGALQISTQLPWKSSMAISCLSHCVCMASIRVLVAGLHCWQTCTGKPGRGPEAQLVASLSRATAEARPAEEGLRRAIAAGLFLNAALLQPEGATWRMVLAVGRARLFATCSGYCTHSHAGLS